MLGQDNELIQMRSYVGGELIVVDVERQIAGTQQADGDNPPDFTLCPITHAIMRDPVILKETGQSYERDAISKWLSSHSSDPLSNTRIHDKTLIPNVALKNAIAHALSDHLVEVTIFPLDGHLVSVFKINIFRDLTVGDLKRIIYEDQKIAIETQLLYPYYTTRPYPDDGEYIKKLYLSKLLLVDDKQIIDTIIFDRSESRLALKLGCITASLRDMIRYKTDPKPTAIIRRFCITAANPSGTVSHRIILDASTIGGMDFKNADPRLLVIAEESIVTNPELKDNIEFEWLGKNSPHGRCTLEVCYKNHHSGCSGQLLYHLKGKRIRLVISDETVSIEYINLEGRRNRVDAKQNDCLESVARKIATKEGLADDTFSVFFDRNEDGNTTGGTAAGGSICGTAGGRYFPCYWKRVAEYDFRKETMRLQLRSKRITIFVKSVRYGRTLTIDCAASDPIVRLKEAIKAKVGIPEDQQRLTIYGKRMENQTALSDYGVDHKCTVHCDYARFITTDNEYTFW